MRVVKVWGCVAWVVGFLAYNWINPGTVTWWTSATSWLFFTTLGSPTPPSWLGASLVAFVVSFVLQAAERLVPSARVDR
jgi:hypothetical protein